MVYVYVFMLDKKKFNCIGIGYKEKRREVDGRSSIFLGIYKIKNDGNVRFGLKF